MSFLFAGFAVVLVGYVVLRFRLGRQRRAHARVVQSLAVKAVTTSRDGKRASLRDGVIEDLHAYGAALRCPHPIDRDCHVDMSLPLETGDEPVAVRARIVHRRKTETPEGTAYVHGLAFRSLDSESVRVIEEHCTQRLVETLTSFPIQGDDLMTAQIVPTPQLGSSHSASAPLLSIFGGNARIEGTFEVEESIEVQCDVSGELRVGGTLVIGDRGRVSADVTTVNAVINGSYTGNLKASGSVEIAATGRVTGTLESAELVITKGAVFTGSVTHVDAATQDQLGNDALLPQRGVFSDVELPIPVTRLIELDLGRSSSGGGGVQPPAH